MNEYATQLFIMFLMLLLMVINLNVSFHGSNIFGSPSSNEEWQTSFNSKNCNLTPSGANSYFILEPGYQLILEGKEDGTEIQLKVNVLNMTKIVNGIEARVIEEVETEDGEIVEISRNWFVVCRPANDIFYLGEEVDIYEDCKIVDHEGDWEAGLKDAKLGLIMPGKPEMGMKYYQEIAPGVAEDRAEIVGLDKILDTPAGRFDKVLETEETNALKPDEKESKFYAPGIGLIQEETLKLVKYGNATSN